MTYRTDSRNPYPKGWAMTQQRTTRSETKNEPTALFLKTMKVTLPNFLKPTEYGNFAVPALGVVVTIGRNLDDSSYAEIAFSEGSLVKVSPNLSTEEAIQEAREIQSSLEDEISQTAVYAK